MALASLGFALGLAALADRRRLLRVAVVAAVLLCLADWVLIQDFGVLGGLGTDPDSMIPLSLLLIGAYLAVARIPDPDAEPDTSHRAAAGAGPQARCAHDARPPLGY